jgi:dipeptidyl aminopeptidase/acylaminoacyl peptidase
MGFLFPEGLKAVWRMSNGLDLPGGWRLFPVFDPAEPRKTCNHIGYENTKGRWSYMDQSLISIAGGDTGNQLVLKRNDAVVESAIYLWDHETNKVRPWGKGFDYILSKAEARVLKIEKQIGRSTKKSGRNA